MSSKNLDINKNFYNRFWKRHRVFDPKNWPHWKIINNLKNNGVFLEIGPGVKPKIPVKNNYFLEISEAAVVKLNSLGGIAAVSDLTHGFPFDNDKFDIVCAFEILEHINNDDYVLNEIHRVIKNNGYAVLSIPLNMKYWNAFDKVVGHVRRYNPEALESFFRKTGLKIKYYAKLGVSWPGKISGILFAYIYKYFPLLIFKTTELIDSTPLSSLKQNIHLENWTGNSADELTDVTTGLFVLIKAE